MWVQVLECGLDRCTPIMTHNFINLSNIPNMLRYLYETPPHNNWKCGCNQVLECGLDHCKIALKGLELQVTSCHTTEATRVDEMFDDALARHDGKRFGTNKYAGMTVSVLDASHIQALSDARGVLTGVIDSPTTLKSVVTHLPFTLLWLLNKKLTKGNKLPTRLTSVDNQPSSRSGWSKKDGPAVQLPSAWFTRLTKEQPRSNRFSDVDARETSAKSTSRTSRNTR